MNAALELELWKTGRFKWGAPFWNTLRLYTQLREAFHRAARPFDAAVTWDPSSSALRLLSSSERLWGGGFVQNKEKQPHPSLEDEAGRDGVLHVQIVHLLSR